MGAVRNERVVPVGCSCPRSGALITPARFKRREYIGRVIIRARANVGPVVTSSKLVMATCNRNAIAKRRELSAARLSARKLRAAARACISFGHVCKTIMIIPADRSCASTFPEERNARGSSRTDACPRAGAQPRDKPDYAVCGSCVRNGPGYRSATVDFRTWRIPSFVAGLHVSATRARLHHY